MSPWVTSQERDVAPNRVPGCQIVLGHLILRIQHLHTPPPHDCHRTLSILCPGYKKVSILGPQESMKKEWKEGIKEEIKPARGRPAWPAGGTLPTHSPSRPVLTSEAVPVSRSAATT